LVKILQAGGVPFIPPLHELRSGAATGPASWAIT